MALQTHKEFLKVVDSEVGRIIKWIKKTESPPDALKDFIYLLVTELGESHFITLGILQEVMLDWRNVSDRILREEMEE